MADNENKIPEKYLDDKFEKWMKNNNKGDASKIWQEDGGEDKLKDIYKEYEDAQKSNESNSNDGATPSENSNDAETTMVVGETNAQAPKDYVHIEHDIKDTTWIEKRRESWKHWCEKEHDPKYEYVEDKEFQNSLKFDVYKTPQDKEAGNKAASIHYIEENKVTIETDAGKVPDYEFFSKLVKEAKKDGLPGVTFEGEMTDEFKARLAAACLEHGMNMKNGPEKIDTALLGNVSEDLKKTTDNFNFYQKAQKEAKAQMAQLAKDGKPSKKPEFNIKDVKDPEEAAILYATYTNAGFMVLGSYEITKHNKGKFNTDNLTFMSDKEKEPLTAYNQKQDTIDKLRARVHKEADKLNNDKTASKEDKELIGEREATEIARDKRRKGKELNDEDKKHLGTERFGTRKDMGKTPDSLEASNIKTQKTHNLLDTSLLKKLREEGRK